MKIHTLVPFLAILTITACARQSGEEEQSSAGAMQAAEENTTTSAIALGAS